MPRPYFVADQATVTALKPVASSAFGSYKLSVPEDVDINDIHMFAAPGNELGYVASLAPKGVRVGGFARRFVRADVSVTAADTTDPDWVPSSDVDKVLTEAAARVEGDFFLESDITKAGLGPWIPFTHFEQGDLATVEIWGRRVPLPVTRIDPKITDHDENDWSVHVGGQVLTDDEARLAENETLRQAAVQSRREVAGLESQTAKAVESASTAKQNSEIALRAATDADGVIQGHVETAWEHTVQAGKYSDAASEASDRATAASEEVARRQPIIERYAQDAETYSMNASKHSLNARLYTQASLASTSQSIAYSEQSHAWSQESHTWSVKSQESSEESHRYSVASSQASETSRGYSETAGKYSKAAGEYSAAAKTASDKVAELQPKIQADAQAAASASSSADGFSRTAKDASDAAGTASDAAIKAQGLSEKAFKDAEAERKKAEEARSQAEEKRSLAENARSRSFAAMYAASSSMGIAEQARAEAEQQRAKAEEQRGLAETARGQAEGFRNEAEERRDQAEQERKAAEAARDAAEDWRDKAEAQRLAAETARGQAEEQRGFAEKEREKAENARSRSFAAMYAASSSMGIAEQARAEAEQQRQDADNARKAAEVQRGLAEQQREQAEGARDEAEKKRVAADNARKAAEVQRGLAEQQREQAEGARDEAEKKRVAADNARRDAEAARDKAIESLEDSMLVANNAIYWQEIRRTRVYSKYSVKTVESYDDLMTATPVDSERNMQLDFPGTWGGRVQIQSRMVDAWGGNSRVDFAEYNVGPGQRSYKVTPEVVNYGVDKIHFIVEQWFPNRPLEFVLVPNGEGRWETPPYDTGYQAGVLWPKNDKGWFPLAVSLLWVRGAGYKANRPVIVSDSSGEKRTYAAGTTLPVTETRTLSGVSINVTTVWPAGDGTRPIQFIEQI